MIELIDKRKPNEKRFLKDNGNIEIQMFRNNIHYLKDGKYEEISNELKENEETLENFENDYKVIFNKKNGGIKYLKGDNYIEFIPKDYKNVECILEKNTKEVSKVLYKNIIDNIDLEYVLSFEGVKENIIINEYTKLDKIQFDIKSNLTIKNENKVLEARKEKELLFDFSIPYMKDSNGNESDGVTYSVRKKEEDQLLTISFSNEWLKEKDRKYPVVIDPSMETNDRGVDDTYIYPGDTNDVRYNRDYIITGVTKVNNQDRVNRGLLKFVLPELGTSDEIIRAELNLYGYMAIEEDRVLTQQEAEANTDKIISIHEVTSDWTLQGANWTDMSEAYNQNVENIAFISRSYLVESLIDSSLEPVISTSKNDCLITDLVKRWYNGSPNYGIMIKQPTETYINQMTPMLFSSNFGEGGLSPVLTIEYRNQNGLELYWDYMIQEYNNGNTYINSFNGNLTALFTIGYTIGVFPVNIGLVYNTNDVVLNNNTIYGKGYKLTYDQTIEKITSGEIEKLKYIDGDGTIHYFYLVDEVYLDEDGLNYEIEFSTNICTLKDKKGNEMSFTKNGSYYYLSQIKNIMNQEVNIIRNSSNYITKVTDCNSNEINIIYNNNQISFVCPNETILLNYENDNLKTIVTKEGTITFQYNGNNIISKIVDVTGMSIEYEYYNGNKRKIRKTTQYGLNHTEGQSYEITYDMFSTKVTDNNGKEITKIFNYYGNLLSQNNMIDGSNINDVYSISETFGNEENNYNKLLSSCIPFKFSSNLFGITNYINIYPNSVFSNNMGLSDCSDVDFDGVSLIELYSDQINQNSLTGFSLPDNEIYTVSLYIKTELSANIKFYLYNSTDIIYEKNISQSDDFEKIFFTFSKNTSSDLMMRVVHENPCSTYIGDILIEKSECINDYNIIDNSDFADGTTGWALSASEYDSNNILNLNDIFEVVEIDNEENKALKVNMNPKNMSHISKKIDVKGTSDDLFYLAFWFKNAGLETGIDPTIAHDGTGSIVGNTVSVYFEPYDGPVEHCIPTFELNVNKNNWQFFSMPFYSTENFKSIRIELHQGRESGELYLTNFSLIKKPKASIYDYDENGNLLGIKDSYNSKMFNYDKKNELINANMSTGKNIRIEYSNYISGMIIRTISSNGLSNRVIYDDYGNIIKNNVSKNYSDEIVSGYYKIRQKGTNNYLKILGNDLTLKSDYCSNSTFIITKDGEKYSISDSVLENKYITELSNLIVLSNVGNNKFNIEQNTNGSYHIYLEGENESKKYLKWLNNHFEFVSDYSDLDDNYLYEYYFEDATKLFIQSESKYTEDGRFLTNVKDPLLNETKYFVNNINGLVTKTTNANGIDTLYYYNNKEQITKISQQNKEVIYSYNNQNLLSQITQGNKIYELQYDDFLNICNIKANNNNIITNSYGQKNGKLLSSTFGNNDVISYQYDSHNLLKKIIKEDETYELQYNNNGNISGLKESNSKALFIYDNNKRIKNYINNKHNKTFRINNTYDNDDNIILQTVSLDNENHSIIKEFDIDGNVIDLTLDNFNVKYYYDDLLRIIKKKINESYEIKYEYVTIGNRTSKVIKSVINGNDKYLYKYDKLYNITDIFLNNQLIYHYQYDDYNELIEADNYINNIKVECTYNNEGNIISRTEKNITTNNTIKTDLFEYNNNLWEDLLTKYNNEIITYDEIGNPLTIGTKVLTWINGRQLSSIQNNGVNINYKYNVNGFRTEKTINNNKIEYYLDKSKIIYEKRGEYIIYYLYCDKEIIGIHYNNEIYYFIKNLQNDIIGIIDLNNNLVAKYEYDSFGNTLSIKDANNQIISNPNHIGLINPFRYRSYYYDDESNMYYINNRYYCPEWGRFLNADGIIGANQSVLGQNSFLYTDNNYISRMDSNGNFDIPIPNPLDWLKDLADLANSAKEYLAAALGTIGSFIPGALPVVAVSALAIGTIVAVDQLIKVSNDNAKKRKVSEARNQSVYVLLDPKDSTIKYAGRTKYLNQTITRHKNNPARKDLILYPVQSGLTKEEARGVEQLLIERCNTYLPIVSQNPNIKNPKAFNQINGVNPKNKDLSKRYKQIAATWLEENEIPC